MLPWMHVFCNLRPWEEFEIKYIIQYEKYSTKNVSVKEKWRILKLVWKVLYHISMKETRFELHNQVVRKYLVRPSIKVSLG